MLDLLRFVADFDEIAERSATHRNRWTPSLRGGSCEIAGPSASPNAAILKGTTTADW